ncbi:MAG: hypothetical protein J6U54_07650 [Clostridiales bacterium]|nr:hypothetical protein [Clostridiales bacterium]
MCLFKRKVKSYTVDISFNNPDNPAMHQQINVCARTKKQAIKAAKQVWEPYYTKYDLDWTKSKKDIKYKIHSKRRIK